MALAPGTRIGHYEVTALIGRGGMGEVWSARDERLGRVVALKVLAEADHLDEEAVGRFNREAVLLASLNHPNVATLHGLESAGDATVLVMEYVDGKTLDELIAQSGNGAGLPLDETLDIAEQIAAALDVAHQSGIVHRDLKPANIKVRSDGTVKVLDFGIAKALSRAGRDSAAESVTRRADAVIGTPSYMSPEQAAGAAVDSRADIWAFGCVLFEMLTGQRAFDGDSSSRILARVIEREPDYDQLPAQVPPGIRRLLRQCLEKDPRKRRRDAGDIRLGIQALRAEPDVGPAAPARRAGIGPLWLAAAVLLGAGATALAAYLAERPSQTLYAQITTPPSRSPQQLAVSPDGRYVVYVALASSSGTLQSLYLWDIESGEERRIPNAEGGVRYPFWSPDSRSIGYFDDENLYRIDIDGGGRTKLAPSQNGQGGSWGADGTIIYTSSAVVPLFRVPASGGDYESLTTLDAGHRNHSFASFFPDGKHFLFLVTGEESVAGVYLGSLDGATPKRLIASGSAAVSLGPDRVAFEQNGRLVASVIDLEAGVLTGDPIVVASALHATQFGYLPFSASTDGVLAYRETPEPGADMTIYAEDGSVLAVEISHNGPDLSWDDRFLAYDATISSRDVYIWDLELDTGSRGRQITFDTTIEGYPTFYPGDQYIVYERQRDDDKLFELWTANPNRTGQESLLFGDPSDNLIPMEVSAGEYVLYRRSDLDFLSSDLEAVKLSAAGGLPEVVGEPIVVANSRLEERNGTFSPDGALVAFDAYDPVTERSQVFVQTFPEAGDVIRVPTEDGISPRFRVDEDEGLKLYFVRSDGTMMSSRVSLINGTPAAATPVVEFATRIRGQAYNHQYDVTRDGRFFVETLEVAEHPEPIMLILNWRL